MPTRLLAVALLFAAMQPLLAEQPCSSLSALTLPYTTITSAINAPEGPVRSAGVGNTASVLVPARCEVQAITRPSKDSEIRLQVWLPASGWNGKYLQVGNGGWAGQINQGAMADPLRRGYAVAATDDGHASAVPGAAWAVGHPEKLIDLCLAPAGPTVLEAGRRNDAACPRRRVPELQPPNGRGGPQPESKPERLHPTYLSARSGN